MAVYLANSGGAWDNAKKLVEDGHHGGKGSPAHEATVIGDGWDSGIAACGVGGWFIDCRWMFDPEGFSFCEDEYEAPGGPHAAQGCR
jgi:hypothetical protein